MTFVPGRSGNPSGRPKAKPFQDAIRKALARAADIGNNKSLDALADKLLTLAAEGNVQALFEIINRLDGRPAVVHEGNLGGPPIQIAVFTGVPRKGEDVHEISAQLLADMDTAGIE